MGHPRALESTPSMCWQSVTLCCDSINMHKRSLYRTLHTDTTEYCFKTITTCFLQPDAWKVARKFLCVSAPMVWYCEARAVKSSLDSMCVCDSSEWHIQRKLHVSQQSKWKSGLRRAACSSAPLRLPAVLPGSGPCAQKGTYLSADFQENIAKAGCLLSLWALTHWAKEMGTQWVLLFL